MWSVLSVNSVTTEMTDTVNILRLPPEMQKFILHWGEMGTRWGVNRTAAQVHALLFLSSRPLAAEEIAVALSVARSNVSTSLRELQAWGIVRAVPLLGDRRQHFASMEDPWEMFRVILEERKRRELDPTISVVRECVEQAKKSSAATSSLARARMEELLEFIVSISGLYDEFRRLPPAMARKLLRLRGKVRKFFGS
jgi:DNA-binding transcriptional regulator GbsR (MarR family)